MSQRAHIAHRGRSLFVVAIANAMAMCIAAQGAELLHGPQPREVYREFVSHQSGDLWRVTNPDAKEPRARRFLPNPELRVAISSLDAAVRAEVMLDRWGGHVGTTQPRIRFNGKAWLDVPPPVASDGLPLPVGYNFQDNPVIAVPLDQLQLGDNTFEGTCGHETPQGWGQWGLYSLVLRVYYDPSKMHHPAGRITSPVDGATFGEDPTIRLEASSENGVARVDVLAWYDGFDENGDGVWLDWHGARFQPIRGQACELRDHVGTLWRSPYELVWDTRWVPDQAPGSVRLIACIQDSRGTWSVTQPVSGLTLRRADESVQVFRATSVPPRFGVRNHSTKSCLIHLPVDFASGIVDAGLHYRTWHGWDGHHHPFQLNGLSHLNEGKNHHYDYDIHVIAPSGLRAGDNEFTISSDTQEHMLEVLWPGPALTVRFRN